MQSITKYTVKTKNTLKRTSSVLSPPDNNTDQQKKKPIKESTKLNYPSKTKKGITNVVDNMNGSNSSKINNMEDVPAIIESAHRSETSELERVIGPLVTEVKLLRESMDEKYTKLETALEKQKEDMSKDIEKIEKTLDSHKAEISSNINSNKELTTARINSIINENKKLRQVNVKLLERIQRIESQQLSNNVIITGISENPWEGYEVTKQRVCDTIAASIGEVGDVSCQERAQQTEIACCSRVGRYRPNYSRPISVTFQKKEDKESLLSRKRNLPAGIYVNEEYPIEIKKTRDRLRPILRLAKSLPEYKDKSRLEYDRLVIDGKRYGIGDLHRLPSDLAPYKTAEKTNEKYIAFHGEHSPYSNFHYSPFVLNNTKYVNAEQWIQHQKSLLFNDNDTANKILETDNPYEIKQLSRNINGFDKDTWRRKGYDICYKGVEAKFKQNESLLSMLKSTGSKRIVEATTDRLWGTGVSFRDVNVLIEDKWYNLGWLSEMLQTIRNLAHPNFKDSI